MTTETKIRKDVVETLRVWLSNVSRNDVSFLKRTATNIEKCNSIYKLRFTGSLGKFNEPKDIDLSPEIEKILYDFLSDNEQEEALYNKENDTYHEFIYLEFWLDSKEYERV